MAEDNLINQLVVVEQLKVMGYDVAAVHNGLEALKALESGDYDLVLMDCQMPELDGYDATRRIREGPEKNRRIPIVALTAHAMQEDLDRCLARGHERLHHQAVRRGGPAAEAGALAGRRRRSRPRPRPPRSPAPRRPPTGPPSRRRSMPPVEAASSGLTGPSPRGTLSPAPELPDLEIYLEALRARIEGEPLAAIRLFSPFLLRTVEPALASFVGRRVVGLRRLGKRIVFELEGELFLVLHLMIAGRLHWKPPPAKIPGKIGLAAFDFPTGTLLLTEASAKKRASLHLVRGEAALAELDPRRARGARRRRWRFRGGADRARTTR